ncbi:hypothetical protein H206_05337 [Candidatus Electrothrix aarhusensis]|uniref:Uncharacterized protein n=1 Tax=Candidatus Electrothrix aarhusensis TaxID=1859131 RepID=A0A444J4V7_9BACT|nr:hypothetical protein H206_05337 [Candidatus Electrothrix aarhusensis]
MIWISMWCISFGCGPIMNDCHKAGNKARCSRPLSILFYHCACYSFFGRPALPGVTLRPSISLILV